MLDKSLTVYKELCGLLDQIETRVLNPYAAGDDATALRVARALIAHKEAAEPNSAEAMLAHLIATVGRAQVEASLSAALNGGAHGVSSGKGKLGDNESPRTTKPKKGEFADGVIARAPIEMARRT